jgi:hypothetical protein
MSFRLPGPQWPDPPRHKIQTLLTREIGQHRERIDEMAVETGYIVGYRFATTSHD